MAVPSLNLNYTVLSTCDTTSGWSTGSTEPDIKKQGSNSLVTGIRNGATVTYTTGGVNMSAPDAHLRLWLFHTFAANLATKANGGIQLFVTGGGTNYYYVGGSDTHTGAWELFQCNLAAPDVNGGANLANITAAGFVINHATAARNIDNTWWDYFVFGTGYEVKGGTSVDPVTWADLAEHDRAQGIGLVQRLNGVYFINGELTIGDKANGTTATHFDSNNEVAVFYNAGESTSLYKLVGDGGAIGANINLANTVIKSASNPFQLNMSSTNINAMNLLGSTVSNAGSVSFNDGQVIDGTVFNGCDQISPSTATFINNTIAEYTGVDGAILWPGGTSVQNCSFLGNSIGVEHLSGGTQTYIGLEFDGNTFDINNSSGTALTILASAGSNPSTFTGSTVTIENTVSLSVTGVLPGSDVVIYNALAISNGDGSNVLQTEDEITGTSSTYSYNFTPGQSIHVGVFKPGYIPLVIYNLALSSTDQSLPVSQVEDRNYVT